MFLCLIFIFLVLNDLTFNGICPTFLSNFHFLSLASIFQDLHSFSTVFDLIFYDNASFQLYHGDQF